MAGESYLVAGLGNIGPEYAQTRHNMGFMVLDAWRQASNTFFSSGRYGDIAEIKLKGRSFHLLKPSTYMNLSGKAVRYWMNELNIPVERVMVICDDLNLPYGTLRMRPGGSDGGHNGLKNIQELLGTQSFARLRMGIGHEFAQGDQVDYVLGKISEDELKCFPKLAEKAIQGIKDWAFAGISTAMNSVNAKNEEIFCTNAVK